MANSPFMSRTTRGALAVLAGAAVLAALPACDLPGTLPATRALENGVISSLTSAKSFEITGSYAEPWGGGPNTGPSAVSGARRVPNHLWTIDLQVARLDGERVVVTSPTDKVEAIILGNAAYFRGQDFLSQHMGSDPLSRNLVRVTGNAWWKGASGDVPRLTDLTDGASFRATFLGTVVTQRFDHVSVDGVDAVELSGPRADVFIAAQPPYRPLRVRMKKSVVIDGIGEGDLRFANFDRDFGIAAPADVIDFSNLSTLPPLYTVVSVDTSRCASTCIVSALLKNLGGISGAKAPSTVTFTMSNPASGQVAGSCHAEVRPDVGYNATTNVSCPMDLNGQQPNAAIVSATADNPGHA